MYLNFSLYCTKQMDSTLPCVCSVIDHSRHQNVVRMSVTHSPNGLCATCLFLPHFDVICYLLLNRCTATWNPFLIKKQLQQFCVLYISFFQGTPPYKNTSFDSIDSGIAGELPPRLESLVRASKQHSLSRGKCLNFCVVCGIRP